MSRGGGAAVACLLLLPLVLAVLKTDFMPQQLIHDGDESSVPGGVEGAIWQLRQQQLVAKSKAAHDHKNKKGFLAMNGGMDGALIKSGASCCNLSSYRTNMCAMQGDVRVHGKAATVYVVSASDDNRPDNGTITIRPYPRKWETPTMQLVREVTIRWRAPLTGCAAVHGDLRRPGGGLSTGGYGVNIFHAITDIIIPLYNTAREYDGRVRLIATNYDRKWIAKHRHALSSSPSTLSST
ncbi:hypothetical protein ZWY2020_048497 [Hordeum vulgare]|nr:hypothetical protein ZWY2020_048497 [Hordeum vulgare]